MKCMIIHDNSIYNSDKSLAPRYCSATPWPLHLELLLAGDFGNLQPHGSRRAQLKFRHLFVGASQWQAGGKWGHGKAENTIWHDLNH